MNPGTAVIVNLLGGVALLLWGVRMVRTGVTRAYRDRLKNFIEHRVGNRVQLGGAVGVEVGLDYGEAFGQERLGFGDRRVDGHGDAFLGGDLA